MPDQADDHQRLRKFSADRYNYKALVKQPSTGLFYLAFMPSDIVALIENPYLLVAMLLIGGAVGMVVEQVRSTMRRRAWREKNRWRWEKSRAGDKVSDFRRSPNLEPVASKRPDSADQLRIVIGADFTVRPLLNKSEARLFRELDRVVLDCNPGWQVMAQVSLGEILQCKDPAAYSCINSKRIDLLLMDENCQPRHAVEYQGGAHYQSTAAARDAVKKEALRQAGVMYHEVVAGQTTPAELRRLIERLVDRPVVTHND